jgi:hypothetical protein
MVASAVCARKAFIDECVNEVIRSDLEGVLKDGRITEQGLRTLRSEYNLTWRELQIFVRYYLLGHDLQGDANVSNRRRLDLATRLGITEYTVRHHINAVRSKIGHTSQRGVAMYHWAIANDIVRPQAG